MTGPRVAVIGLGKMGLPMAAHYASNGARVYGVDIDERVVEAVNRGECPIVGEPGLPEAISAAHENESLRATTDTAVAVRESDVVILIVPVGIDSESRVDFSHLDAAAQAVGEAMRPGQLVVLETTVPVGVTRHRLLPRLLDASGLAADEVRVAFSPERVSSGSVFRDLTTYPKLVGGLDEASGDAAVAFYQGALRAEVRQLASAETAEFAKLAESIYRDVNIALANELAVAADSLGVDYREAAAASNTQPYSHLHAPGVGVGGHCIPVYPYFLMEAGNQPLVALSRKINDSMAAYAVEYVEAELRQITGSGLDGSSVLVLGLAYRAGVKEATLSSTLLLVKALEAKGARVLLNDPLFGHDELRARGFEPSRLPPQEPVDAVILQAAHREYAALDYRAFAGCKVLLDGRRALDRERVEAAGIRYLAIGLGK